MTHAPRLRRRLSSLTVVLAVLAMVGHVCAAPAATHVEAPGVVHAGGAPHEHDGEHLDSCEAATAGLHVQPALDNLAAAPIAALMPAAAGACPGFATLAPDRRADRPPLFLLHAALLI